MCEFAIFKFINFLNYNFIIIIAAETRRTFLYKLKYHNTVCLPFNGQFYVENVTFLILFII